MKKEIIVTNKNIYKLFMELKKKLDKINRNDKIRNIFTNHKNNFRNLF